MWVEYNTMSLQHNQGATFVFTVGFTVFGADGDGWISSLSAAGIIFTHFEALWILYLS